MGPASPLLRESTTILRAHEGRVVIVLGTIKAKVQGTDKAPHKQLKLHVVEGNRLSLLGEISYDTYRWIKRHCSVCTHAVA